MQKKFYALFISTFLCLSSGITYTASEPEPEAMRIMNIITYQLAPEFLLQTRSNKSDAWNRAFTKLDNKIDAPEIDHAVKKYLLRTTDFYGFTALHNAVAYASLATIKKLVTYYQKYDMDITQLIGFCDGKEITVLDVARRRAKKSRVARQPIFDYLESEIFNPKMSDDNNDNENKSEGELFGHFDEPADDPEAERLIQLMSQQTRDEHLIPVAVPFVVTWDDEVD